MEATVGASPFEPSLWHDYFVTYAPPISEKSETWMRERVDQLTRDVQQMFDAHSAVSAPNVLRLVDELERLGVDNHFQEEIDVALRRVHNEKEFGSSAEMYTVALRFRLLRQHGFFVSTDVFNKFKDGTGNFNPALAEDPRGFLSLYNAAHMAVPGDHVLDNAIAFTRSHLKEMKGNLGSPIADQITRALNMPLARFTPALETLHYISEYEQEETHNVTLLELARLNYSIRRSLHIKELRVFTLWWKDLYEDVKLTYSRDRTVEMYFWAFAIFQGEENSRARILFSKMIAFISLMDDTYDAHATFEECKLFCEALERWDKSAASILPEYLRAYYIKILSIFDEFVNTLEPREKYRVPYVQKAYILLSKYYLQEAKWCNENYIPSFEDQLEVSTMSSSIPVLALAALMAVGDEATKEAVVWISRVPDMVLACGEIGRLLNDISAWKKGRKNTNDVASSLECYVKDHGTTREEAASALTAMVEHAWRRINKATMEIDPALLPAVKFAVINFARVNEIMYIGGNDGYTFSSDLEGFVAPLFLKPVPI